MYFVTISKRAKTEAGELFIQKMTSEDNLNKGNGTNTKITLHIKTFMPISRDVYWNSSFKLSYSFGNDVPHIKCVLWMYA